MYRTFLADDCVMQSNNHPPIEGKAAILQSLSSYWTTFNSLTHDLLNIYGNDSSFALEALNNYKSNDEKVVTVGAVAITDRNSSRISNFYQTLHGYNSLIRIDRSLTLHQIVSKSQHHPYTSSYDFTKSSTRPREN